MKTRLHTRQRTFFSQEGTDQAKMDFTYQLEGDKFTQAGTITYLDGKVVTIDALVGILY